MSISIPSERNLNFRDPEEVDKHGVITEEEKNASTKSFASAVRKTVDKRILSIDYISKSEERVTLVGLDTFLKEKVGLEESEIVGVRKSSMMNSCGYIQIIMDRGELEI